MSFKGLPKKAIRGLQKEIRQRNSKFSSQIVEISVDLAKDAPKQFTRPVKAFRSNRFIIQVFEERGFTRISVNRAMIDDYGNYLDGITWELFEIKNSIGYADADLVEIYPAKKDLTKVANIRHLWVVKELPMIWRG